MRLLIIEIVLGALLVVMALALLFEQRLPRRLVAPHPARLPRSAQRPALWLCILALLLGSLSTDAARGVTSSDDQQLASQSLAISAASGAVSAGSTIPLAAAGINTDINSDGVTNIVDIQRVAACRGKAPSAPGCSAALDVNHSGTIDDADITLVANRWRRPFTTILRASPADGENQVAVTRETIIEFSAPINPAGITPANVFAQFGGQTVPSHLRVSPDHKRVTLFYNQPLPASSRVRVTVNGDNLVDASGYSVDADGDGVAGGAATIDFDTLSLSRIAGTDVWGYVYDSYNKNQNGTDRPVIGATIRVDGFPQANAVTDQNGYFILHDMPAPIFFVHVDGSTATNAPSGTVYATVGKPFHSSAGRSTQLTMDGMTFNIYLPPMSMGDIKALSPTTNTNVGFGTAGKAELVKLFPNMDPTVWDQTKVTFPPKSAIDEAGTPATQATIIPVPPNRIPAPLPPNLRLPLVISIQAMGATNFDTPAPVCLPNLADPDTHQLLPAGAKSGLFSFNHDTGQWEMVGPMTVSADGRMVCTDPGVGVRAPGWHGILSGAQGGGSGGQSGGGGNTCQDCKEAIVNFLITAGGTTWAVAGCIETGGLLFPACIAAYTGAFGTGYYGAKSYDLCRQCFGSIRVEALADDPHREAFTLITDSLPIFEAMKGILDNAFKNGEITDQQRAQLRQALQQLDAVAGGNFASKTRTLQDKLSSTGFNVSAKFPPPGSVYYAGFTGGVALRNRTSSQGRYDLFLGASPNGVLLTFFDPVNWTMGFSGLPELRSGQRVTFPDYLLTIDATNMADTDKDGLPDVVELVVGTKYMNPDTDGDGINDGAEVRQGTDPLDGLPAVTGIIATAQTPGTAFDIAAYNDLAVVAELDRGVSVLSVANGASPTIVAQVDTPGNAQAVAFFGNLVAVADGPAGLAIVDVTDPPAARIIHQVDLGTIAQAVTTDGRIAYVGLATGEVAVVDMVSGVLLDRLAVGSAIEDLALDGNYLYALTVGTLYSISLDNFGVVGSVASPGAKIIRRWRLFVGGGIAYATHRSGYNTFSLANPGQPARIAVGSTAQLGWKQIIANGSGLGVAAVGPNGTNDGSHDISLYDVSNPAATNAFLTTFVTPGLAAAVSIYNGLAYVADSDAGIQVINYRAYDSLGRPPTIALSTSSAGNQAEEGKSIRVSASVGDDVQVRNVEFYVDGVKAATDGNFPFEYRFITPLRSQQPSFTLRARAIDTGGNNTWTVTQTVTLIADATPPHIVQVSPQNNSSSRFGEVAGISARFSEPINPTMLTGATFQLFGAGPDGVPGNGDDVPITGGSVTYRDETNTALLAFNTPLAAGAYRAVIGPPIADTAGNPLAAQYAWTFNIKAPIFWAVNADGFWDTPGNWSTGVVPGPSDVVVIDRPAGNYTITVRTGAPSVYSLRNNESLVVSGGTLTLGAASSISNGLALSGGTLVSNGDLILSGSSDWSGGNLSGAGSILANGTLNITGAGVKALNAITLVNAGTVTWSGTGTVQSNNGGSIRNQAGAVFDILDDATLGPAFGAAGTFTNLGTVRKSAGSGTSSLSIAFSGGQVAVLTGTLSLSANNTTTSGGSFTVASGAVLDLTGGGTHNYIGSYSGSGAGTISLGGGTLSLGAAGASFNFSGSLFQWGDGALGGTGSLTNTGTLNITGAGVKALNAITLVNAGTVTWSGTGMIQSNNGGSIRNQAGAVFDILDDATLGPAFGAAGTFTNLGTVRKSAGSGTSSLSITFSGGQVAVLTGTLSLSANNTTTSGGSFTVASGAVLDLTGGGTHNYVGSYSGSGAGTISLGGGTLSLGAAGASFNFSGSLFQWGDGALGGTGSLTNTGTLNITGAGSKALNAITLVNAGTVTWSGAGTIQSNNGGSIRNQASAVFDILDDATLGPAFGSPGTFTNLGLMRKLGGAGTTNINIAFNSSGAVDVQNGTLNFGSNVVNAGVISLGPSPRTLTIAGNYTQAAAGVLNIKIGGLNAGTEFDQVTVGGSATLDGTLNVSLINGFAPALGNTFQVLNYGSHNGVFATINDNGQSFTPIYGPTNLTLSK